MKLKFKWNEKDGGWNVLARCKSTNKFEIVGFCHSAARAAIASGNLSLVVWA